VGNLLQKFQTAFLVKLYVEDNQVKSLLSQLFQRFLAIAAGHDGMAFIFQFCSIKIADVTLVINNQQMCHDILSLDVGLSPFIISTITHTAIAERRLPSCPLSEAMA
jgi:hypothetical protein